MKAGPVAYAFLGLTTEGRRAESLLTSDAYKLEHEIWMRAAHWTLEEAVAISFGRDPRYVKWSKIEHYISYSPRAYEYAIRREIVFRAKEAGYLPDPIRPAHFISWALQIGLPCSVAHHELYDHRLTNTAASELGAQHDPMQVDPNLMSLLGEIQAKCKELEARNQQLEKDLAVAQERREMSAPERSALTKLVFAMARDKYGYDPSTSKSTATSKIESALDRAGLHMDPKTIRDYLRTSANEVRKLKPRKNQE